MLFRLIYTHYLVLKMPKIKLIFTFLANTYKEIVESQVCSEQLSINKDAMILYSVYVS